eukprot:3921535-Pyramimonas_sp.AAC.1
MCLDVEVKGRSVQVEVLRPMHPCDNLFVVYKPDALAAVIHSMREMGFDGPQKREPMTKNVHKRNGFFPCQV